MGVRQRLKEWLRLCSCGLGELFRVDYLWACARLAEELEELIEAMGKAAKP